MLSPPLPPFPKAPDPGRGAVVEPRPSAEEVIREEYDFIHKIACDCGTPVADADDIVQLVAQDLLLHPERIPPRSWLRNWLYVVASRKARDFLEKRATMRRHEAPLDSGEVDPDWHVPSGEELLSSEQTRRVVLELLDELPSRRREVLRRYEIQGDDMGEIAESLSVRLSTAYNLLRLAREDLKALCVRRWAGDEHKPGGRSFALLPLLVAWRGAVRAWRRWRWRLRPPTFASVGTTLLMVAVALAPAESGAPAAAGETASLEAATMAGGQGLGVEAGRHPAMESAPPAAIAPDWLRMVLGEVEPGGTPILDQAGEGTSGPRGNPMLDVEQSPPLDIRQSPPLDVRQSPPLDVRQSPPLDIRQSPPLDVRQSLPLDVRQSPPLDVRQSLPLDVHHSHSPPLPLDIHHSPPRDAQSAASPPRSRNRAAAWALITRAWQAADVGDWGAAREGLRAYDLQVDGNPFASVRSTVAAMVAGGRDVRQSLPRDVRQSLPRDVRQSLPRDVRQSLSREGGGRSAVGR